MFVCSVKKFVELGSIEIHEFQSSTLPKAIPTTTISAIKAIPAINVTSLAKDC